MASAAPLPARPPATPPTAAPTATPTGPPTAPTAAPAAAPPVAPIATPTGCAPGAPVSGSSLVSTGLVFFSVLLMGPFSFALPRCKVAGASYKPCTCGRPGPSGPASRRRSGSLDLFVLLVAVRLASRRALTALLRLAHVVAGGLRAAIAVRVQLVLLLRHPFLLAPHPFRRGTSTVEQDTCPHAPPAASILQPSSLRGVPAARPTTSGGTMAEMEKSIVVDAPLREVYNQWTQFEEFPSFME